ncbi:hypothetical protein TWF569_006184 [Orbilia oligospora]|nr:hypothetical protein TWF569_006184 [Orbilia oligospora]
MKFLNIAVLTALGLASAAVAAPAPEIAVETAPSLDKLPDPTKTITVSYTIRTLHSCSPTVNAKKWRA